MDDRDKGGFARAALSGERVGLGAERSPRMRLRSERPTATFLEAAIVLGIPVAAFIERHVRRLVAGGPLVAEPMSDTNLLATLVTEILVGGAIWWWLHSRGWRVAQEVPRASRRDVVEGVALWLLTFAVVRAFNAGLHVVAPALYDGPASAPLAGALSLPVYLLALAINPAFEELLWLGYAIPTVSRSAGVIIAAVVSILFRVLVHFPQGAWALRSIVPVAVVWTGWFLWRGRLWPVVVAHIINNAFGLGDFVDGVGKS